MRNKYPFIAVAVAVLASCSASQPTPAQPQQTGIAVMNMDNNFFHFYRDPITGCEYIQPTDANVPLTPRYADANHIKGCGNRL